MARLYDDHHENNQEPPHCRKDWCRVCEHRPDVWYQRAGLHFQYPVDRLRQKEIAKSEAILLLLKDGTADYLNIVWAVLANNLNGKAGHREWIVKHGGDFGTRLAALRAIDGSAQGATLAAACQEQYDAWLQTVVNPLVAMRKKVDEFATNVSDLSDMTEGFGAYLGTEKLIASIDRLDAYERALMKTRQGELESLRTKMYVTIFVTSALA